MDKLGPKVSVIIPTYNRAHVLGRAVRSVLDQTCQDFELIVVDDCSMDNTEDVVLSFRDHRIRYVRLDSNSGTPAAPTNIGIKRSVGRYIAVEGSDDEWLPIKLEKEVKVLDGTPSIVGVVYCDMWRIGVDGARARWRCPRVMPADGIVYQQALDYRLANIGNGALMVRRECFDRAGLFDEFIPRFIDAEWLIRVSKYYHFYHIDEPLVRYYTSPGGISANSAAGVSAREYILHKFFEDIQADKGVLARHYFLIGRAMSDSGEMRQGRAYLVRASRMRPPFVKAILLALLSLLGWRGYRTFIDCYSTLRSLLRRCRYRHPALVS